MFSFLLVVHTLIAASLVGVILMQRSEGGGLAGGGSPAGLMSARGAADFLTRTTAILATLFVTLSIGLAAMATIGRSSGKLDASLNRPAPQAPSSVVPMGPQPATGSPAEPANVVGAAGTAKPAQTNQTAPATAPALPPRAELPTPAEERRSAPLPTPRVAVPATRNDSAPVIMPRTAPSVPRVTTSAPAPATPAPAAATPATTPAPTNSTTPQPQ